MRNKFSFLPALAVILLPVLVAMPPVAIAQTARGHEGMGTRHRITAAVITVAHPGGDVIRTTDGGKSWMVLDAGSVASVNSGLRVEFADRQLARADAAASPNPTAGMTTVSFHLSQPGEVLVTLHDYRGVEVLRQVEGIRPAGAGTSMLNASGVANGMYWYRVTVDGAAISSGKVMVAR